MTTHVAKQDLDRGRFPFCSLKPANSANHKIRLYCAVIVHISFAFALHEAGVHLNC